MRWKLTQGGNENEKNMPYISDGKSPEINTWKDNIKVDVGGKVLRV